MHVPLTGSSSPAPMRRAQSSLCLGDETLAGRQRRRLSSRFPEGRSSASFSPGDTPRQRFRQRRPGPLGAPSAHSKGETESLNITPHYPLIIRCIPLSLCVPVCLAHHCLAVWPSGCLLILGSGVEWDGSIKTLSEHEADDTREGEWGVCPIWGLWQASFISSLF